MAGRFNPPPSPLISQYMWEYFTILLSVSSRTNAMSVASPDVAIERRL